MKNKNTSSRYCHASIFTNFWQIFGTTKFDFDGGKPLVLHCKKYKAVRTSIAVETDGSSSK